MPNATKAMTNSFESKGTASALADFSAWMTSEPGFLLRSECSFFHPAFSGEITFVPAGAEAPSTGLLVHEDMWQAKRTIIQSRIASLIGANRKIHGRLTQVFKLNQTELNAFLSTHHLQGPVRAKVKLGLVHNGDLVAVAAFAKPCPVDREGHRISSVEWVRYCSATGLSVVGALDKLFKHYCALYRPQDVMSMVDLEWTDGSGFEKIGFRKIGTTAPVRFAVNPNTGMRTPASALSNEELAKCLTVINRGNTKWVFP